MIKLLHSDPHLSHIYDIWHTLFDTLLCGLRLTNKITCIVHLHVNKFLTAPGLGGWVGYILQMLCSGKLKVCITLQPLFCNVFNGQECYHVVFS